VEEHRLAGRREPHVGLDAVGAERGGAREGLEGVLGTVGRLPAVGEDEQAAAASYGQIPRDSATSATRRMAST
jgi:hypothetical protein